VRNDDFSIKKKIQVATRRLLKKLVFGKITF